MRTKLRRARAAAVAAVSLTLASCGSFHTHQEIVAAAGGEPVAQVEATAGVPAPTEGTLPGTPGSSVAPSGVRSSGLPVTVPTSGSGPKPTSGPVVTGPSTKGGSTSVTRTSAAPTSAAFAGKQDATPVAICQIGTFTGVAGSVAVGEQAALTVWVKYINTHGGVGGHPVQLDSKDDASDGNNALQIAQNCVQNEHAVALVANFVPTTYDNIASYLSSKKVPMIGDQGVNEEEAKNPFWFSEASGEAAINLGVVHSIHSVHASTIALIYCAESPACGDSARAAGSAAQKAGIAVKGNYSVTTANPSYTSQCSQMKSDGVQAVYIAIDGPSMQRVERDCRAIGFTVPLIFGGLAVTPDVADDPNMDGSIAIAGVFPWVSHDTPAQQLFQQSMATYAPDVTVSESAARAWTSGMLFAKAIEALGTDARTQPITSAMVLAGLAKVKNETLGGLTMGNLSFSAGSPTPGAPCFQIVKVSNRSWTAPEGSAPLCS